MSLMASIAAIFGKVLFLITILLRMVILQLRQCPHLRLMVTESTMSVAMYGSGVKTGTRLIIIMLRDPRTQFIWCQVVIGRCEEVLSSAMIHTAIVTV